MSNEQLFEKARKLAFPKGDYALFGSAPLGIRDIRECADIDIIVSDKLWNELKSSGNWRSKITEFGTENLLSDDEKIEIVSKWLPGNWDTRELINGSEVIEGLPFVKLEHLIRFKKLRGKEKDMNDLDLIQNYLSKNDLHSL